MIGVLEPAAVQAARTRMARIEAIDNGSFLIIVSQVCVLVFQLHPPDGFQKGATLLKTSFAEIG